MSTKSTKPQTCSKDPKKQAERDCLTTVKARDVGARLRAGNDRPCSDPDVPAVKKRG